MRRLTEGNGPRGTIRFIETLAASGTIAPLGVHRGRPTSDARGSRPAQQNDETEPAHRPRSVILVGMGRQRGSSWTWADDDRYPCPRGCGHGTRDFDAAHQLGSMSDKPKVSLDKRGMDDLVMAFHAPVQTTQTKPILPKWRSDRPGRLMETEQTKPILPEWQYAVGFPRRVKEARERSQPRQHGEPSGRSAGADARERSQCLGADTRKARERTQRNGID